MQNTSDSKSKMDDDQRKTRRNKIIGVVGVGVFIIVCLVLVFGGSSNSNVAAAAANPLALAANPLALAANPLALAQPQLQLPLAAALVSDNSIPVVAAASISPETVSAVVNAQNAGVLTATHPNMTSMTTPSPYKVTHSSTQYGRKHQVFNDTSVHHGWSAYQNGYIRGEAVRKHNLLGITPERGDYVYLDHGKVVHGVRRMEITASGEYPTSLSIITSNDGVTFRIVHRYDGNTKDVKYIDFSPTSGRYWGIVVHKVTDNGGHSRTDISNLKFLHNV
jgi:hypothetical protein